MSQFIRKGLELYIRASHKPWNSNCLVIRHADYVESIQLMQPRFYTGLTCLGAISYSSPFGKELVKAKNAAVTVVDHAISNMIFGDSHKT